MLGGARSGKSRYAEGLIASHAPPWFYIATAEALDGEMDARIRDHQARRDDRWATRNAPHDLPEALSLIGGQPVLVDCLTLWLTNLMMGERDLDHETTLLEKALKARSGPVVLVSNEVGSGIVPDNKLARRFLEAQGRLNQRMAAIADHVTLVVAGLPLKVK